MEIGQQVGNRLEDPGFLEWTYRPLYYCAWPNIEKAKIYDTPENISNYYAEKDRYSFTYRDAPGRFIHCPFG